MARIALGFYRDYKGKVRPIVGGNLTTEERNGLPDSAFADPTERKYPIPNASHARNALARVQQYGTPRQKRQVCAFVTRHFPEVHASSCSMHEGRWK